MAKLTLFFRNRVLGVRHLEDQPICIGRHPDCEIVIDSLAVAERHAHVVPVGDGHEISPYAEGTPIIVNHQAVTRHRLSHGDMIQIGKHTLAFAESVITLFPEEPAQERQEPEKAPAEAETQVETASPPELPIGGIQIMNGTHLGKVIPLQRALTRISLTADHCAIVARRPDGYYLSHLEGDQPPAIEGHSIGDLTVRLEDGNRILLDGIEMLFFAQITQAAATASQQ